MADKPRASEAEKKPIQKPKEIVIKPAWLSAMIPQQWFIAATHLANIQAQFDVPDERMADFIQLGATAPVPLVEAVRKFASGEWLIEVDEAKQQINIRDGKSPVILPKAGEISRYGKH